MKDLFFYQPKFFSEFENAFDASSHEPPELIGYLIDQVPGISPAFLPSQPGMTVLYGVSGAGKTRILRSLQNWWQGVDAGSAFIFRIPEPEDDEYASSSYYLTGQLFTELLRAWDSSKIVQDLPVDKTVAGLDDFLRAFEHQLQRRFEVDCEPEGDLATAIMHLSEEARRQRIILVRGAGNGSVPKWRSEPIVLRDSSCDSSAQQAFELVWQARDDLEEFESYCPFAPTRVDGLDYCRIRGFGQVVEPDLMDAFEVSRTVVRPANADATSTVDAISLLKEWRDVILRMRAEKGTTDVSDDWHLFKAGVPSKWLAGMIHDIESLTNRYFAQLLIGAPSLQLRVNPTESFMNGPPLTWTHGFKSLEFSSMSSAEIRWSRMAMGLATFQVVQDQLLRMTNEIAPWMIKGTLLGIFLASPWMVLDEPERALHRSAEARMAKGLALLVEDVPSIELLVSTHSPELLDARLARLAYVSRDGISGLSSLRLFSREELDDFESLGLTPSDMLRRQQGFMLVEGLHDQILLDCWIGPQLAQLRVEVLPLRGAKELPKAIDSRLLFQFTEAKLFVLLDNLDPDAISRSWEDGKRLAKVGSLADAKQTVLAGIGTGSGEQKWLGEWLTQALERNQDSRVFPHALPRCDILEYLPAGFFVDGAVSWDDLRNEWRGSRAGGDFKSWLVKTRGADFSETRIRSCASSIEVPQDLANVLSAIEAILDE